MRSSVRILRKSSRRRRDLCIFVYFSPHYHPFCLFDVKSKRHKCFTRNLITRLNKAIHIWVPLANVQRDKRFKKWISFEFLAFSSFSQKPKQQLCYFDTSDSESCLLRTDCVTSLQVCRSGLLAKCFPSAVCQPKLFRNKHPKELEASLRWSTVHTLTQNSRTELTTNTTLWLRDFGFSITMDLSGFQTVVRTLGGVTSPVRHWFCWFWKVIISLNHQFRVKAAFRRPLLVITMNLITDHVIQTKLDSNMQGILYKVYLSIFEDNYSLYYDYYYYYSTLSTDCN